MKRHANFRHWILPMLLLLGVSAAIGQTRITGTVTDSETGAPLIGATVENVGTSNGTVTDLDGKYAITAESGTALRFSYIGYSSVEKTVGAASVIDIALSSDGENLDEVVVTALGIRKEKKALTYAVQTLQSESIVESQQPNIVNSLQGKVAGVMINNSSGAPGAASVIMIRGGTSLSGNNQPLFVVDGIPIDNSAPIGGGIGLSAQNTNNSNRGIDINPEDIASLTVLKGPAAAVLYGLRASEGAIIITTKKGQAGSFRINYSNAFSYDVVNKVPEFQTAYKQGIDGNFNPDARGSWGPAFGPNETIYDNLGNFFQPAVTQRHDISASGGSERSTFYLSASRFDQNGIVPNTSFDRTSFRLSADSKIAKNLRAGGSVNYINSQNQSTLGGSGIAETNIIGATGGGGGGTIRGLYNWPLNDDARNYITEDGKQRTLLGVENDASFVDNPYWSVYNNPTNSNVNRVISTVSLSYDPFSFLNITYRAGTDFYDEKFTSIRSAGTVIGGEEKGAITEVDRFNQITTSTLVVTGKKSLGRHINTSLALGHNVESARSTSANWYGRNFIVPTFASINNVLQNERVISAGGARRRIVGAFADFNADWKSIFFLNIRARNDWSSTLPVANRSFFYPSFSGGIVLTDLLNEIGVANGESDFIPYAKVRASWTRVGKDAPPHVLGNTYFNTTNSFTAGPRGFIANVYAFGAPALRPEFTNAFEAGVDIRLFKGKIGIDFTYYNMKSDDQILFTRVPPSASSFISYLNGGRIDNEGVELMVNARPVKRSNFTWNIDLNFSRNTSTVVELPGTLDRVEQSDASVDGFVAQGAGFLGQSLFGINGDVWKRNEDGKLLLDDMGYPQVSAIKEVIGDRNPDFIVGLTNSLRFGNFNFSFLWDFRIGGDIYNATENALVRNGLSTKTLERGSTTVFDGIIESTGEPNTQQVVLDQNYYQTILRGNGQLFVEDGSWYRLRYATLSYRIPKPLLERINVKGLEVYATGRNLILITNYSGVDPEVSSGGAGVPGTGAMGMDNLGTPSTKGADFGLRLSF
ncbi:SusC/RagA family TonB-linked outer membrane protein [Phaeodactylibacter luteus]|uniref:SusC/RagA family TonB-linked outer membrane protein n=1 Tax=Phaeodactylibacter luteus TaxID=1564516 RepID=A0A5C6RRF3_9BACT|nr:SusC/RagA family TonB-linked outer membrane protein [Phaeodactylibacter luteus]TXB64475.1 SusC/RagA family TonB-linked outer membrane protein [Phaeodactylibacter luteus]